MGLISPSFSGLSCLALKQKAQVPWFQVHHTPEFGLKPADLLVIRSEWHLTFAHLCLQVGTDILEEQITAFEDFVQSMDVAAFNKIWKYVNKEIYSSQTGLLLLAELWPVHILQRKFLQVSCCSGLGILVACYCHINLGRMVVVVFFFVCLFFFCFLNDVVWEYRVTTIMHN